MTVAVIFTSRRAEGHDADYAAMSARMAELVQQQPGFLRMSSLRDPITREGITVAWFADEDSVRAWKEQVDHRRAQERGIRDFYDEYHVSVATVDREYGWQR